MSNNFVIYKYTSPSGKSYIGQTNNIVRRTREHKQSRSNSRLFRRAIEKYGWETFTYELLADNLTIDQSNYLEEHYIAEYNTMSPFGYNLKSGGLNHIVSEETRRKMSQPRSSEHRRKISEALRRRIRKPCSDETKRKLSEANKGKPGKKHTEEARQKMRKPKSLETKQKMSLYARTKRPPMSEETKRKISQAKLGTKRSIESVQKQFETRRLKKLSDIST